MSYNYIQICNNTYHKIQKQEQGSSQTNDLLTTNCTID